MIDVSSLYIHFPFCLHQCNYCDFYKRVLTGSEQVESFEELLLKQWEAHKVLLSRYNRKISDLKTLYIGGGTPSLWKNGPNLLSEIFEKDKIKFSETYECTLEVDPGTCTPEELDKWISFGVNRFSVGVQSYDETLLKTMDRIHGIEDIQATLSMLGERKLNFSVDLMIGLPESVGRSLSKEIISLSEMGASHFSVYILKARKNYLHYDKLPTDNTCRNEYLEVCSLLKQAGYEQYEVSNFAKPGKKSSHNQQYWDYQDVAAIGPNSSGLMVDNNKSFRYQWKSLSDGHQLEEINGNSLLIEKLFLGFRTYKGINLYKMFRTAEHPALDRLYLEWSGRGYLASLPGDNNLRLNSLGYLMSDSLCEDLFREIEF